MPRRRLIALFSFIVLTTSQVPGEAPAETTCESIPTPTFKSSRLQIKPARAFQGAAQGKGDPLKVVLVLLKEYLSHAKDPKESTTVTVDVSPEGRSQFRAFVVAGEKKLEAAFVFPDTLNPVLMGLTEEISREIKTPLKAEKILPFANETASAAAFLRYADGVLALEGQEAVTSADAERAVAAFEEASQADYNYVSAYAGLAEALAAQAALTDSEPIRMRAKVAMQKAKLLNPYQAKIREKGYSYYLKARCGEKR